MVETEEELKSLVDKGDRGEREKKKKDHLKLNIHKTKIMVSSLATL